MIRKIKILALFLAFVILPLSTIHGAETKSAAKTHAQLVTEYIELSGSKDLIESFPTQIQQMLAQKQAASSDQEKEGFKKIAALFDGAFDEKNMLAKLSDYLLKTTDSDSVEKFIEWLKSPLAKKIMEEKAGAEKNDPASVVAFMDALKKTPLPPARLSIIQDMEEATGETEFALGLSIEVLTGMLSALNSALPPERKMPKAQVEAQIESIDSMLRGALKEQMITALSYSFQNMTDKELKEYTAFYKTDIGTKERLARIKGFAEAVKTSFANLEKKIVTHVLEKSKTLDTTAP